jgi:hypothetical protein
VLGPEGPQLVGPAPAQLRPVVDLRSFAHKRVPEGAGTVVGDLWGARHFIANFTQPQPCLPMST